jgi:hypothetical protein
VTRVNDHYDGVNEIRQMPVAALESVDRVLPDLKEREMYATLALLRFDGSSSKRVIYSRRDLFLMVTDGITEVANDRDEEFGLTRLEGLLTRHATRALPEIWDLIMREVRQYGLSRMTKVCSCCACWTRPSLSRPEFQRGAGDPKPRGRTMSEPQYVPGLHSGFSQMTGKPSPIR